MDYHIKKGYKPDAPERLHLQAQMFFFKVSERLTKKIGKCTSCAIYFANTGKKYLIAPQIKSY